MMSSINGSTAAGSPPLPAAEVRPAPPPVHADKPAPVPAQKAAEPSDIDLDGALQKLNAFANVAAQNVQFSIDQDSGKTIVKVVDTQTQEVLRQIPNAEALSISRSLGKLQGLLIHEKA